ncbi:patatin family protein [Halobacillus salinarum]|uniref:Patatin family protein n=2 Tax=Halobacillus salinarum TaxID=2932257 RepID=A0ABY4EH73_9BACI|nr:patatin family protein [Halobacillus salinarum]
MRGAYTAGVLDFFLDEKVEFQYVAGASAGACNGSSYISKQRGRNYEVIVEYGSHPEYISFTRMLTKRQLFGMDFIFDTLPNRLVPFDFKSFYDNPSVFVVGTTDMTTGKPLYFDQFPNPESLLSLIRASSSIPLMAPSISYQGYTLMDGGIADPIPIGPSISYGNQKHVVILTQNDGYIKKKMKLGWYMQRKFREFPQFTKTLINRHSHYNEQLKQVKEMEKRGEAFVFRPIRPMHVSRVERKRERLHNLYIQGYQEARLHYDKLVQFLQKPVLWEGKV